MALIRPRQNQDTGEHADEAVYYSPRPDGPAFYYGYSLRAVFQIIVDQKPLNFPCRLTSIHYGFLCAKYPRTFHTNLREFVDPTGAATLRAGSARIQLA
jgi:hypothetical protein